MDQVVDNGVAEHTQLSYFLWLPAGKDEFGFDRYEDAPLGVTSYYRTVLEQTIADRFAERAEKLRDANRLAFMTPSGRIRPVDAELGLRKIQFRFSYQSDMAELEHRLGTRRLDGTAIIFSNGLYLWSFDIPIRPGAGDGELTRLLRDFLVDDFVERHVRHLFDFQWAPDSMSGDPNGYTGVLTYFQLDLLFNGIFDQSGHPHLSLGDRVAGRTPAGAGQPARAAASYDVHHLIKSLSLGALERDYFPLFDQRKNYSLRRTYEDPLAYIDCDISLREPHLNPQDPALHLRELFLSRLSFAAMEQFIRVTVSFGLTHYKTGVDHVRSELVSQGIEASQNRASGELRRPSLNSRTLTLPDLDSYHTLLSGKIPTLRFLGALITGLAETSRPSRPPEGNGIVGAIEWLFSNHSLGEAQTQLRQQIDTIEADVDAIGSRLSAVRDDLMLAELSEGRKLAEIEAEVPHSAVIEGGQWGRLTARLAVFAAIIGVAQLFGSISVWLTDRAFTGEALPPPVRWYHVAVPALWVAGVVGLILLVVYFGRGRYWPRPENGRGGAGGRPETHVFDYAAIMKPVRAVGGTAAVIKRLRNAMVDIEDRDQRRSCANLSTFLETPSSGIARTKYSLECSETENRLSYVLHLETDGRLGGDRSERLLDVRLVIRRPTDSPEVDIAQNTVHVVAPWVEALLFPDGSEGEIRAFFRDRFGWDWPPTQSGPALAPDRRTA